MTVILNMLIQNVRSGDGIMAQWVRTHTVLSEDPR